MPKLKSRRSRIAVIASFLAIALASCTSGSPGTGSDASGLAGTPAGVIGETEMGQPQQGGTLTFAVYTEVGRLDPAASPGSGPSGGSEMAAVFDVLMRVDGETDELEPQLAESLTASNDSRTWTLKLRDGVRFSDGTAMTADAVKGSIERYVRLNGGNAAMWEQSVAEIQTPDDNTVVFQLNDPWAGFGFLLAGTGGMIVAPDTGDGEDFTPVGAGPFTLASYAPNESMVLAANPDYWGGPPYLDAVRIVYLDTPETILDSLAGGSIDMGFLRDQAVVNEALNRGYGGVLRTANLGNIGLINAAEGHPGADARVRKAMFQAIDPGTVVNRATQGAGVASSAVFSETSKWAGDTEPLPYDPDAARALLDEAKADGYDGIVGYLFEQTPNTQAEAVAVQSMLGAVGFDVRLEPVTTATDKMSRVLAHQNYDVASWGLSLFDDNPYDRLNSYMHSDASAETEMYRSPELDRSIDSLRTATSAEDIQQSLDAVQNAWNEAVPALVFGPVFEFVAMTDGVRGVVGTTNTVMLLDQAWIAPAN